MKIKPGGYWLGSEFILGNELSINRLAVFMENY